MNTASRSKKSTAGSVTSPCTSSSTPACTRPSQQSGNKDLSPPPAATTRWVGGQQSSLFGSAGACVLQAATGQPAGSCGGGSVGLTSAMACSVGMTRWMSVTPESELVVAPAGYSLKATTPASLAAQIACRHPKLVVQGSD